MKTQKRYAIFARTAEGVLYSMSEASFNMPWTTNLARTWETPPKRYFRPQDRHFIICTTREYPDFYFTGRQDRRGNLEWKLK